jgi:hypothetical protein
MARSGRTSILKLQALRPGLQNELAWSLLLFKEQIELHEMQRPFTRKPHALHGTDMNAV